MVVGLRLGNAKADDYRTQKRWIRQFNTTLAEIFPRVKMEFVDCAVKGRTFQNGPIVAPIGIGAPPANLSGRVVDTIKYLVHAGGRLAGGRIQNMGREFAHGLLLRWRLGRRIAAQDPHRGWWVCRGA